MIVAAGLVPASSMKRANAGAGRCGMVKKCALRVSIPKAQTRRCDNTDLLVSAGSATS